MYKEMYHLLFNAITDALKELEKGHYNHVRSILIVAQADAEDFYLEAGGQNDADP